MIGDTAFRRSQHCAQRQRGHSRSVRAGLVDVLVRLASAAISGLLISSAVAWLAATQFMLLGVSWIFTGSFEGRGLPAEDHAFRIGQVLLAAAASVSLQLSKRATAWLFLLSLSVGVLLFFFVENWTINFLGQLPIIVFLTLACGYVALLYHRGKLR